MQTTPTTPTTPPIPTPAQVAAQTFAEQKINGHKVVIFSKTYCPYCTKAKNVIKKYNVNDLDIIELDNREDCELVIDYLNRLTGARSVSNNYIAYKALFFAFKIYLIKINNFFNALLT